MLAKLLIWGTAAQTTNSTQNPSNNFANIPDLTANAEIRADFSFRIEKFEAFVKPRLNLDWQHWQTGDLAGESDQDVELFVNEWEVRFLPDRKFVLGFGRLNLQWGPSYFISPSNPFFRDNGQANPKREVPGMEFFRLLWFPDAAWTISVIANTDEGRQEYILDDFERVYAVKVDHVSYRQYYSLIGSYREDDLLQLGGYGNWSLSDALMLYMEGNIMQGSAALYPNQVAQTPFGPIILMDDSRVDDSSLEGTFLWGASYTFNLGPTLTMEYVFNSPGYGDREAEQYYDFRKAASIGFESGFPLINKIGTLFLAQTLETGLRLLRQNYLVFQYQQAQIADAVTAFIRVVHNLDDGSTQLIPYLQYDVTDHAQLFVNGLQTFGPQRSEFRSLLQYGWLIGVEYTF
ncbi:MAG: hypothetical protein AUK55_04655 [Syntrophobacteraceae bacterium CG2_30_61_12]|nr:MAG: hypothetical protein AUK55_04655 [Syntrophobacteraceae bacterium CG2_30_61_12]